jgi:integrase
MNVTDIDRNRIGAIAHLKRMEPQVIQTRNGSKKLGRNVSAGTVNRVIGVLKAVLNAAAEWEWVDRMPRTKKTKIVSPDTLAEAERLLAELSTHLADMAQFSLENGLRRAKVTGLLWSQVDLVWSVAWIHPDQAKARRAITLPL